MNPFHFELDASNINEVSIVLLLAFGLVATVASLWVRSSYLEVQRKAKELEEELQQKNKELQHAIAELKATQVRLIESGKVSAAAALSAGILHQISQPITAIHGFVRFMKQEMPKENLFYRPVCLMDEQSVYLKEMLDNLMSIIRHRKIEKTTIAVNAVVERSLNLLTDELRIRRVHWETAFDQNIPQILADPIHLQQIFMNIAVNACEALSVLPRGEERQLQVSSKFDNINRKVKIAFKNNGPGIPEEVKNHIFEPFFSTKISGSGVGLALCHDLVAEHGGTIEVDSGLEGTTFTVILPVEGVLRGGMS